MVVLHLLQPVHMSVRGQYRVTTQNPSSCHTYRRLFLSILSPRRLCAQVRPHTPVSATVDTPTGGRLRVEYGQLGDSPLNPGRWCVVVVVGLGVSSHQPLPVIAPVFVVVVIRIRVERVGKCAVFVCRFRVFCEQASCRGRRGAGVEARRWRGRRPLLCRERV
jgi:hypothetical protein